jgi:hypothetical protein
MVRPHPVIGAALHPSAQPTTGQTQIRSQGLSLSGRSFHHGMTRCHRGRRHCRDTLDVENLFGGSSGKRQVIFVMWKT